MSGFVILFGSAAAGSDEPRDLDVVVGGDYSVAGAESAARAWWLVEHGGARSHEDDLAQQLRDTPPPPVEVHRQSESYSDGSVYLIRPRGAQTKAIVLRGEAQVRWTDVDSLPAAIRLATDGHADLAQAMMERLRTGQKERIPLSLDSDDKGRPIGTGGYDGDGPIALESALARIDPDTPLGSIIPSLPVGLNSLLTTIRAHPGVWSGTGTRRFLADKGGVMEGLRRWWISSSPLGCRGYVGQHDVFLEYAASTVPIELVEDIILASAGESRDVRLQKYADRVDDARPDDSVHYRGDR